MLLKRIESNIDLSKYKQSFSIDTYISSNFRVKDYIEILRAVQAYTLKTLFLAAASVNRSPTMQVIQSAEKVDYV